MATSACLERVFGTPSLASNILCRLASCPAALGRVSCVNTTLRAAANGDGEAAWRAACVARFPSSVVARAALRDTTAFSWRKHFCGRMKALQPPICDGQTSGRTLDGFMLCVDILDGEDVVFSCCVPASEALYYDSEYEEQEDDADSEDEGLFKCLNLLSPVPVFSTSPTLNSDDHLRACAWVQRPDGKQTALVGNVRGWQDTTIEWEGRGLPVRYAFGGRPATAVVRLSLNGWALDQTGRLARPRGRWQSGWRPRPDATSLRLTKLRPRWRYIIVDVDDASDVPEPAPEDMVRDALEAVRWV